MAKAIIGFSIAKPSIHNPVQATKLDINNPCQRSLRQSSVHSLFNNLHQSKKGCSSRMNALPHWPIIDALHLQDHLNLMAVMVQHIEGDRDLITVKSVVHLSDRAIKNVYVFYMFFTIWGCLFFGSMKDPYYDSEAYRKDGGDGTGHWLYEKQEDIEESSRAELWREELIEEIEQKVDGLRELEEVGQK